LDRGKTREMPFDELSGLSRLKLLSMTLVRVDGLLM
jgi:hypothetical protein